MMDGFNAEIIIFSSSRIIEDARDNYWVESKGFYRFFKLNSVASIISGIINIKTPETKKPFIEIPVQVRGRELRPSKTIATPCINIAEPITHGLPTSLLKVPARLEPIVKLNACRAKPRPTLFGLTPRSCILSTRIGS